jgi:hypothetical protein
MQTIKEILTPEELAFVTSRSNWHGASIIAFDWAVIIASFVVMAHYPNPLTVLLGLFVQFHRVKRICQYLAVWLLGLLGPPELYESAPHASSNGRHQR